MILSRMLVLFMVALFATTAVADREMPHSSASGCRVVTFCTGEEAGDGDCEVTAGGEINVFTPPGDRLSVTLSTSASAASAFSCHLYGSTVGHDAAQAVTQISIDPVTETDRILSLVGPPVTYWVRCLAVTGTMTLTGHFCPTH